MPKLTYIWNKVDKLKQEFGAFKVFIGDQDDLTESTTCGDLEYAVDCNPAGLESFMKFQIDTDLETQFLKVASVPIGFSGNYTVSVTATLKDYRTATSAK
jgi:hypothetical protein